MLDKIKEVASRIISGTESKLDVIPIELVDYFEQDDKVQIGKLLLQMKVANISFDFEKTPVNSLSEAERLVKDSQDLSQQIYYTLKYISIFHTITRANIEKFLKDNS